MEGLKQILLKELQDTGYMRFYRLEEICSHYHYKLSNGERRMRELHVEKDLNAHGAIIGYRLTPQDTLFNLEPINNKPIYFD